jgi:hypothetical protein
MLLRLRQITVHPCLITEYANAFEITDNRSPELKAVIEEATYEGQHGFRTLSYIIDYGHCSSLSRVCSSS